MPRTLTIVLLILSVTSCVNTPDTRLPTYTKEDANNAQREVISCARKNVQQIDDGVSDAQSIAIALSLICRDEYDRSLEIFALATLENNRQVRMFMDRGQSQESKIKTFLPTVLQYRAYVREQKP